MECIEHNGYTVAEVSHHHHDHHRDDHHRTIGIIIAMVFGIIRTVHCIVIIIHSKYIMHSTLDMIYDT